MAELRDILLSGDIEDIKLTDTQILDLLLHVAGQRISGYLMPQIAAPEAQDGSIFFNTDIDRLCFKRPDGFVVKFKMDIV